MFNFKKVSAILASAVMFGSTIGFAAAANYPNPFVVSGTADVAVVYGASADSSDAVAASNIRDDLDNYVTTDGTTGTTASGGDSVLLAKSSDNLNLGNLISDIFTGTVDDDDLSTLLADGTYVADDNDQFDYEQTIKLGDLNLTHFRDSDYESLAGLDERTPIVGIKIDSNTWILNYTLDFKSDAETDIVNDDADDIEGSTIHLFGKDYYVSNLDNQSGTTSPTIWGDLTLLDTANSATLSEGETTSITIDGTTYEIAINSFTATGDSAKAKFDVTINGVTETTNALADGDSVKLSDGSYLGAKDVVKLGISGEIGSADISVGSGKLKISDSQGGAADIEKNDESVDGIRGFVYYGTGSGGTEKIDKITIEWIAQDEMFLTPDFELEMPGFDNTIKFTMGDIIRPTEEKVTIENDGDSSIEMTVPIKDGDVSINLLYGNSTGEFKGIGKSFDERLLTSNDSGITFYEKNGSGDDYHAYFVATYNASSEAESYLLRAKVRQDSSDGRNETDIEKYANGAWTSVCDEKTTGDSCDIGSVSLNIGAINYTSGSNESVRIIRANNNINFNTIYTKGGLRIYLPWTATTVDTKVNGVALNGYINISRNGTKPYTAIEIWNQSEAGHGYDTWYLYMDGESKEDTIAAGTEFHFTIDDNNDGNLHVTQLDDSGTGGNDGLEVGDGTGIYEAYIVDDVAPRILHYTDPDEDYAEVYYPSGDSETYAEVYLAESGVSITTTGTGGGIGDIAIKDSEISSMSSKNLVVVGGSCINTVAANLVGGAYCTSDWEDATGVGAGQYLIESYTSPYSSSKVALLVAGYNAADTRNAQKALINSANTIDTTAGKKYTGTTETDVAAA